MGHFIVVIDTTASSNRLFVFISSIILNRIRQHNDDTKSGQKSKLESQLETIANNALCPTTRRKKNGLLFALY